MRGLEQSFPLDDEIASTLRASPPSPPINQVLVGLFEEEDPDDPPDDGKLEPAGELGWFCAVPVWKKLKTMGENGELNHLMIKCWKREKRGD